MRAGRILDLEEARDLLDLSARRRCWEEAMEKWFLMVKGLALTGAMTKEEFYGFHADEIVEAHWWKCGHGAGVFFRLCDGRVIDRKGRPHDPDPLLYDQTLH